MTCRDRNTKGYWRNLALFGALTLLAILLMSVALLARSRTMILLHPPRSYPTVDPLVAGIGEFEDVSFQTEDGLELGAWFIPAQQSDTSPTVIFVHGLGANRAGLLDQAKLLHELGYNALLFDLRNHGESEGAVTTLGYAEVQDVEAAVSYLGARSDLDAKRIGLLGHSMGGAIVLRAAARIPEIDAVIAESAYSSLEDNIEQGVRQITGLPPFPFAPLIVWFGEQETGMDIRAVRPIDDVGSIAPKAILFIHGGQDALIDPSNSQRLFAAALEPKELFILPSAGHGDFLAVDPNGFRQRITSFLELYLR
jgi:fermentation-respiration switch protein FrsA (DUF1100 family)